ncbi:MAG: hypothetical protein AAGF32_05490 [Pseudomonadota bacterium]
MVPDTSNDAALLGALIGLVVGIAGFIALRVTAGQLKDNDGRPLPAASIIRWVAYVDLIMFPIVGAFVGPLILG